jgi:signal transduction histidine kinase
MTDDSRIEDAALAIDQAAHDLNNLCTSMLGFAELTLSSLPGNAREQLYVQEIAGSARQSIALAERLRQLAATLRVPLNG